MNQRGLLMILTCIWCCFAQDIWKRSCISTLELTFFNTKVSYEKAREKCKKYNKGQLVKINSTAIANEINKVISPGKQPFFIGGRRRKGNWLWEDGTEVPVHNETGYQKWESNRPFTGKEGTGKNCIAIEKGGLRWRDSNCSQLKNFICHRPASANIRISTNRAKSSSIFCISDRCPPKLPASWYRNGKEVPSSEERKVYQIKFPRGGTKLCLENATLAHSGNYTCHVGKHSKFENVIVPSKPKIIDVKKFACNSSMTISWKPQKSAVGFNHQVMVLGYDGVAQIQNQTPTSLETRNTSFKLHVEDSLVTISIRACAKYCTSGQTAEAQVLAGRNRVLSRVNINQLDPSSVCNVVWTWKRRDRAHSAGDYQVTTESYAVKTRSATEGDPQIYSFDIKGNDSFSFTPKANRRYKVKVRPINCDGPGESIQAIGNCTGPPQAPPRLESPKVAEDESILRLRIHAPNESAGLISCMFVILSTGILDKEDGAMDFTFKELANLNSNGSLCRGYIAIAIKVSRFSEEYFHLGDLSRSTCNIYNSGKVPNSDEGSRFEGVNRGMISGETYSAYIVTTTPSGDDIHFRRSPSVSFFYKSQSGGARQEVAESGFTFQPLSFVIGVFSAMIATGLAIILIRQFIKARGKKESNFKPALYQEKEMKITYENFEGPSSSHMETSGENGDAVMRIGSSGYEIPHSSQQQKGIEPAYQTFVS